MTSRDFCFWLQGYFELGNKTLTGEQVEMIQDHLNLVFVHEIDAPDPTGLLHDIHSGKIKISDLKESDMKPRC